MPRGLVLSNMRNPDRPFKSVNRRLLSTTLIFAVLLAAALRSPLRAQDPQEKSLYDISVSSVTIAVTVQDKRGRFIKDLQQKDFTLLENGEIKKITNFEHDFEAPVSLTVLLDVSGSMALQDRMAECRSALEYLLTILMKSRDETSLLIFADGRVEVAADFSTDPVDLMQELFEAEAYGKTALNDAVAVSPEYARKGKNQKRALLLLTDGIENDSSITPDQALEIARAVEVPIYVVGYKIPLSEQVLKKHERASDLSPAGIIESLGRFSRATGGKAFFVNRLSALNAVMREIRRELSHQYIIGYTSYTDPDSEYRKIEVILPKKKYRVRAREGH